MLTHGIFGSAAPWQADLTLLIEAAMGIALLAGAVLARRRHYRAHAWCQSAVVLLNLVVIGFAMAPSFYSQLAPKIPQAMRKSYYAIAAGHAALGVVAELTGLYVILAAGTNVLPNVLASDGIIGPGCAQRSYCGGWSFCLVWRRTSAGTCIYRLSHNVGLLNIAPHCGARSECKYRLVVTFGGRRRPTRVSGNVVRHFQSLR